MCLIILIRNKSRETTSYIVKTVFSKIAVGGKFL